jgi:hypothetical protein
MQFTGQKADQPASTACLLARKCHWLARKMAANMINATFQSFRRKWPFCMNLYSVSGCKAHLIHMWMRHRNVNHFLFIALVVYVQRLKQFERWNQFSHFWKAKVNAITNTILVSFVLLKIYVLVLSINKQLHQEPIQSTSSCFVPFTFSVHANRQFLHLRTFQYKWRECISYKIDVKGKSYYSSFTCIIL